MNHDLDLLCGDSKEPVRLDHFKTFIHHRGGIDRNLAPHHPVGMGHGLLGRNARQPRKRCRKKGPARCSEQEARHTTGFKCAARKISRQRLKNRIVLTVNRQEFGTAHGDGSHENLPRHHQRLFVGKQHALARMRRCQRGLQTGCAHDRCHHRIAGAMRSNLASRFSPARHTRG